MGVPALGAGFSKRDRLATLLDCSCACSLRFPALGQRPCSSALLCARGAASAAATEKRLKLAAQTQARREEGARAAAVSASTLTAMCLRVSLRVGAADSAWGARRRRVPPCPGVPASASPAAGVSEWGAGVPRLSPAGAGGASAGGPAAAGSPASSSRQAPDDRPPDPHDGDAGAV